jgi:hypothetical protein
LRLSFGEKSAVDIAAAVFALGGALALAVATFALVDANDIHGVFFLVLGMVCFGAAVKIARGK